MWVQQTARWPAGAARTTTVVVIVRRQSFVNAQRHDLQSHTITINQTGFLGPGSSTHGDLSPYNGTGYSQCWDDTNTSCDMDCQRKRAAVSCWEHWSPQEWLEYLRKQAGPGGNEVLDNEDFIGDKPGGCGQI
eukprot:COSAG03_NODE_13164_length_514_cov_0.992771_1_plen_132_part_01